MLFNPTDSLLQNQTVSIPLYYTGLDAIAHIQVNDGAVTQIALDRRYVATLVLLCGWARTRVGTRAFLSVFSVASVFSALFSFVARLFLAHTCAP